MIAASRFEALRPRANQVNNIKTDEKRKNTIADKKFNNSNNKYKQNTNGIKQTNSTSNNKFKKKNKFDNRANNSNEKAIIAL